MTQEEILTARKTDFSGHKEATFVVNAIIGVLLLIAGLVQAYKEAGGMIHFSLPPNYKLSSNGYYYRYIDGYGIAQDTPRYFKFIAIQNAWRDYKSDKQLSAEWTIIK